MGVLKHVLPSYLTWSLPLDDVPGTQLAGGQSEDVVQAEGVMEHLHTGTLTH